MVDYVLTAARLGTIIQLPNYNYYKVTGDPHVQSNVTTLSSITSPVT